ncbi:MAG: polysaccharide export protein EpsE [Burkholderiales bacterium]|jgi:polysaccharide export outer membrane protein|nr:polysaccharide export protein EpsE [Burkholderiales bacterium]
MSIRDLLLLTGFVFALTLGQANAGEYMLGTGDIVSVSVYGHPELEVKAVEVDAKGEVVLPLLGYVAIGGMSPTGAGKAVAAKLKEGGFILKPYVNLLVVKYDSQQAVVLGQVNKPGQYVLQRGSRLTDLLAQAGGVSPTGANTVILQRDQGGKRVDTSIRLDGLFASTSPVTDPPIASGDVIYVPQASVFYIEGEVQKPGAYRLEPGMTLLQAIALGGGLTRRGTDRGAEIHRPGSGNQLEAIAAGKDALIRANDVIDIGQSLF